MHNEILIGILLLVLIAFRLAMVPITAPLFAVFFSGGISPLKIGVRPPYWDRAWARSEARVFLSSWKKSRLLCMGRRTYSAISPHLLNYFPKLFEYLRLSLSIAMNVWRADDIYFKYLKYFGADTNQCNSTCSQVVCTPL